MRRRRRQARFRLVRHCATRRPHEPDTYLQYGTVTIGTGQSSMLDSIMRRSQWLQHHGLHGQQTAEAVRARCCDLAEQQAELFG